MNLQEFGKVVVHTTKFVITDSERKEVMMKIVLLTSQILYGTKWITFQQNDHILEVLAIE
jgi:predicted N-acyltransferase